MKNTLSLFLWALLMSLHTLYAQEIDLIEQRNKDVIGYWKLEDKGVLIIESNGDIQMVSNGEIVNTGTWKMSEDASIFYILEGDDIKETMHILTINEQEFSFKPDHSRSQTITLSRTDKESTMMPSELDTVEEYTLSSEDIAARREMLIGNWILPEENGLLIISADGTIEEKNGGETQNAGTWQLSADGNTFLISDEEKSEEEITIVEITDSKFVVETSEGDFITLVKEQTLSPSEIKTRQKLLIGTWEANTLDDSEEDLTMTLKIQKNGKILSSGVLDDSKSGTWQLSPDGNYLSLSEKGADEARFQRIISISSKELVLSIAPAVEVVFRRIK